MGFYGFLKKISRLHLKELHQSCHPAKIILQIDFVKVKCYTINYNPIKLFGLNQIRSITIIKILRHYFMCTYYNYLRCACGNKKNQ